MWSAHYENESEVKCNDEIQHGFLTENQYVAQVIHCMNHSLAEPHFISQPDSIDLLCDINLPKKIDLNLQLL
jgi:hypothetical protein